MKSLLDRFSIWISQWIRKEPIKPQLGYDFELTELADEFGDPVTGIKILAGQYAGLVYHYTSVKVAEDPNGESATLKFSYRIVQSPDPNPLIAQLPDHEDAKLHFMMGEILNEIIIELGKEAEMVSPQKLEMDEPDASIRTHYSEESDSQQ